MFPLNLLANQDVNLVPQTESKLPNADPCTKEDIRNKQDTKSTQTVCLPTAQIALRTRQPAIWTQEAQP